MDQVIRTTLRHPDSTPQQCFRVLKRAGYESNDIYRVLIGANKLSKAPGHWEQLLVDMGELELEAAQEGVAQDIFEGVEDPSYNFICYTDQGNWDGNIGDLSVGFYAQPVDDFDADSSIASWGISFHPDSAIPSYWDDSYQV